MSRRKKNQSGNITEGEYRRLRAGLIKRGTNLAQWARAQGYPLMTVYGAARGHRSGDKAMQIRRELETYLNA